MMQDICKFHEKQALQHTYGMLRWPNILPLEHRRNGPSNQGEALVGCKFYTDPFASICQPRGSIK